MPCGVPAAEPQHWPAWPPLPPCRVATPGLEAGSGLEQTALQLLLFASPLPADFPTNTLGHKTPSGEGQRQSLPPPQVPAHRPRPPGPLLAAGLGDCFSVHNTRTGPLTSRLCLGVQLRGPTASAGLGSGCIVGGPSA